MNGHADELRGWKEISAYLGKSVRAAQRWEALYGLPIRRIAVPSRAAIVYAKPSEIEAWKAGLDQRSVNALQDELEDDPDTPKGAEAVDNGRGNEITPQDAFSAAEPDRLASVAAAPFDGVLPVVGISRVPAPGPDPGDALPRPPDHSRRRRRLWPWLGVASVVITAAFALVAWSRSGAAGPARPPAGVPPATVDWDRAGLDPGPWPVVGHDRRNSYQSHLVGPSRPVAAYVLYDVPSGIPEHAFAATADGYVVGSCHGDIIRLARDGREVRRGTLDRSVNREAPLGFAVLPSRTLVAVCDCPHEQMSNARTQMTSLTSDSLQVDWRFRTGMQMLSPAVSLTGLWLQIDQYNTLRLLSGIGAPTWIVDLPGFSAGTPAQDADGVVYVPTDGGLHGHKSLWAISSVGRVLWGAGAESFSQAALGANGLIYVYQQTHTVFGVRGNQDYVRAFTGAGAERWAAPVPTDAALSGTQRLAVSNAGDIVVKTAVGIAWLDGKTGAMKHRVPFRAGWQGFEGVVLDAAANVFFAAGGEVVSLSSDGRHRWSVPLQGAGRLIVGHDGGLVVVVDQRTLYVIRDAAAPGSESEPH